MKLAYLLNSYPRTSTTFIRREIEALERAGQPVERFAARKWDEVLVDPLDQAELERTSYLLTGNLTGLLLAFVRCLVTRPGKLFSATKAAIGLSYRAGGRIIPHIAYLLQATYFLEQLQAREIDHVHAHFSTNAAGVAMLVRRLGGPSYSFTVHGPDELIEPERISLGEKTRNAAFVVAITDFCRSQIIRFAGLEAVDKIKTMRCGIDLNDFNVAPPAAADNQTLICLGRLCPQKGQVLLPRVIARIHKTHPNVRVVFIGDGESRAEIEAEVSRLGVGACFDFRGWVENRLAREDMAKGRLLLLPSFAEGLPIVIMEAMALGKPVISTYIAGIPELLDETCGWIIPAGSEAALEQAILAALECDTDQLGQMGKEGRARIEAHHNIDDLAASLMQAFEAATNAS